MELKVMGLSHSCRPSPTVLSRFCLSLWAHGCMFVCPFVGLSKTISLQYSWSGRLFDWGTSPVSILVRIKPYRFDLYTKFQGQRKTCDVLGFTMGGWDWDGAWGCHWFRLMAATLVRGMVDAMKIKTARFIKIPCMCGDCCTHSHSFQ